jgi:hypothetical protein
MLIGAPLGKRHVGHQRKNRIKSAIEGGGGKKKPQDEGMKTKKEKKRIKDTTKCKKCGQLKHRQSRYKCPYNGTKKRKVILKWSVSCFYFSIDPLKCLLMLLWSCRKRKLRKNNTKDWFPTEVSTLNSDANFNTCQDTATKQSTPKKRKKLTPKKKKIGGL